MTRHRVTVGGQERCASVEVRVRGDANVFSARGLEVANLGCGMRQIHTVAEWIDVRDVFRTAELLVETLRLDAER